MITEEIKFDSNGQMISGETKDLTPETELQEKMADVSKKKQDKAVNRMIQKQWAKCIAWKEEGEIKQDSVSKLDKYSLAKLNGYGLCQDIISDFVKQTDRSTFEQMMSENVTIKEFAKVYNLQIV